MLAYFSIAILILIVIASSQKYLFRHLPHDYARHALILDALQTDTSNRILLFGGSQSMFGIDTKLIKDSLHYEGDIYNLSSPGQYLIMSAYYYSLVGQRTEIVVQCVSPSIFTANKEYNLFDNDAIAMHLAGYRIDDDTKDLIRNYNQYFDKPTIIKDILAHTYFKSYLHAIIRPLFDDEEFDNSVMSSLYFPHIYTTMKHPNYPTYRCSCEDYVFKNFPELQIEFLRRINHYFKGRGVMYILVFLPINPDECSGHYQDFDESSKMIEKETGIQVINLSDYLLDNKYFYDAYHPNKDGAKVLSLELSNRLKSYLLQVPSN